MLPAFIYFILQEFQKAATAKFFIASNLTLGNSYRAWTVRKLLVQCDIHFQSLNIANDNILNYHPKSICKTMDSYEIKKKKILV